MFTFQMPHDGDYCFRMALKMTKESQHIKLFSVKDTKKIMVDISIIYCKIWGEHLFVNVHDLLPFVWSSKHAQKCAFEKFNNKFNLPYDSTDQKWGILKRWNYTPLKHLHVVLTDICSQDHRCCSELIQADIPRFVQHAGKMFHLTLAKKLEQGDNLRVETINARECLEKLDRGIIM